MVEKWRNLRYDERINHDEMGEGASTCLTRGE